ncbi:MAG: ASKHA domain-containing protein [Roseburia sp.]
MAVLYVNTKQHKGSIELKPDETIASGLFRLGISVPASCGGNGSCGKCKVLAEGDWVLSCRMRPKKDVCVAAFSWEDTGEEQMQLVDYYRVGDTGKPDGCGKETQSDGCGKDTAPDEQKEKTKSAADQVILAVDLGSTTLAAALVEKNTGKVLGTLGRANRQSAFGGDVLSRIQAAENGAGEELKKTTRQDIRQMRDELLRACHGYELEVIYLAGNTTMQHLFMGDSCETLGRAPFVPVSVEQRETLLDGTPVILLPGIGAFVGADITAGMLACDMDRRTGITMLIDVGTNGEMVLAADGRFYVTSAPAGPAFEGANLSCGMPSLPGAVCKVRIAGNRAIYRCINDQEAAGICGTGVLELVAELLDHGLSDKDGHLRMPYDIKGYPLVGNKGKQLYFTQQDMRQVQMAKAAIRSGIEILLKKAGISPRDVDEVFLAGGFGYYMDVAKAVRIGLLPSEFAAKTKAVGNSSLQGCMDYCAKKDAPQRMQRMIEASCEINLAQEPEFETIYLSHMGFE